MTVSRFIIPVFVLLSLSACNTNAGRVSGGSFFSPAPSPETLLKTDTGSVLIDDEEPLSPLEAHMRARRQVNPSDRAKTSQYTSKGDPTERKHVRTLRFKDAPSYASLPRAVHSSYTQSAPFPAHKPKFQSVTLASRSNGLSPASGQKTPIAAGIPVPATKPATTQQNQRVAQATPPTPYTQKSPKPPETTQKTAQRTAQQIDKQPSRTQGYSLFGAKPDNTATVTGVRTGDHGDRTRLVLDITGPNEFVQLMNNDPKTLMVKIKQAGWDAPRKKSFGTHAFLRDYTAEDAPNGGTTLSLNFKKEFKLVNAKAYPPAPEAQRGHRIVIDIAPQ